MTRRWFSTLALALCGPLARRGSAVPQSPIRTDSRKLPRDYTAPAPVPVAPQIVNASDVPWEEAGPGLRRKVWFNDRQTMALLEFTRETPDTDPPAMHYHAHDQMSFVLEGRARVFVGEEEREIGAGGVFIAPSNTHHGAQVLSKKLVLLDVFTPTREDFRSAP